METSLGLVFELHYQVERRAFKSTARIRSGRGYVAPLARPALVRAKRRPGRLSGRDVRVHAEQVLRIVGRLQGAQTAIVLAERRPHLLGPIVRGQVIHVRAALEMRLQLAPE